MLGDGEETDEHNMLGDGVETEERNMLGDVRKQKNTIR